jgi:hypothetical protein
MPEDSNGTAVLWIDGKGKSHLFDADGRPAPAVRKLLDAGSSVFSVDVFQTGEFLADDKLPETTQVDSAYCGFTFGYNRPMLSNRVRDVLTAIAGLVHNESVRRVQLVGTGAAGPWVLLARAMAGDKVDRTVVDLGGFNFGRISATNDPNYLPGALKYGGTGGLAALGAPARLTVAGAEGDSAEELKPLETIYAAVGARDRLILEPKSLDAGAIAATLLE